MTYLTKEDWSKYLLPRISDDKSLLREFNQIKRIKKIILKIIMDLFQKKENSIIVQRLLNFSIILFYRYIFFNNIKYEDLPLYDIILITSSCVYLSSKIINMPLEIDYVSKHIKYGLSKLKKYNNKNIDIEKIKEQIKEKEFDILIGIGFKFNIVTQYDCFLSMKNYFLNQIEQSPKDKNIINEIFEQFKQYLQKSILLPLNFYYESYEIALGCLLLAKVDTKYNIINFDELIKILIEKQQPDFDIATTKENIRQCAIYINNLAEVIKKWEYDEAQKQIDYINFDNNQNNNQDDENSLDFTVVSTIETN